MLKWEGKEPIVPLMFQYLSTSREFDWAPSTWNFWNTPSPNNSSTTVRKKQKKLCKRNNLASSLGCDLHGVVGDLRWNQIASQHSTRNAKKRSVISSEGDMLVQHVGIVTQVGLDTDEKAGERKRECANISCKNHLMICSLPYWLWLFQCWLFVQWNWGRTSIVLLKLKIYLCSHCFKSTCLYIPIFGPRCTVVYYGHGSHSYSFAFCCQTANGDVWLLARKYPWNVPVYPFN